MATYSNPFDAPKEVQKRVFFTQLTAPDVVKSDCKSGKFIPIGANPADKKTAPSQIEMQVVKFADIPNAVLFPHESKHEAFMWTQVFFVDVRGILCSTLLKNESRDNFLKTVRDCEVDSSGAKNYTDFVFVAAMDERVNKRKEDYFAIVFAPSEISPEDFARNKDFSTKYHESVFCSRTIAEYIKQNMSNVALEKIDEVAAKLLFGFGFIGESTFTELLKRATINAQNQIEA